jgi:hypothetical protein
LLATIAIPLVHAYIQTRRGPFAQFADLPGDQPTLIKGNGKITEFAQTHPYAEDLRRYLEDAGFDCKTRMFAEFGDWEKDQFKKDHRLQEGSKTNCRYLYDLTGGAWVVWFDVDGEGKIVFFRAGSNNPLAN